MLKTFPLKFAAFPVNRLPVSAAINNVFSAYLTIQQLNVDYYTSAWPTSV